MTPREPEPEPEPPLGAVPEPEVGEAGEAAPAGRRRGPGRSAAQTMGGILFGFEQQVLRTTPPPHELVHHARPDAPVPSGDGAMVSIVLPEPADAEADMADQPQPASPPRSSSGGRRRSR